MNTPAHLTEILESEYERAVQIRHVLSAAVPFLETTAENLAEFHAKDSVVLRLHDAGTQKVTDALKQLDRLLADVRARKALSIGESTQ